MNKRLIAALLLSAGFLLVIGMITVMSSSVAIAYFSYGDSLVFFKRHLFNAGLAVGAFGFLALADYRWLKPLAPPAMLACLALLVAVLFVGVGSEAAPVRRWLQAGSVFIQPSELTKFALVLFLSFYLADRDVKENPRDAVLPALLWVVVFLLVVLQPDFGMAFLITVSAFAMLFVAGLRLRYFLASCAVVLPAFALVILTTRYRVSRLEGFIDPWRYARGKGYQIIQSLIALGSGGVFGKGLGESTQKLFYLPQPHTDFAYAILGEELGFLWAAAVVVAFTVLFTAGVKIAARAPERFGCYLGLGVSLIIGIQAAVNLGVCLGLLPTTGIPLPFISYGGASLVISAASVGILVSIARKSLAEGVFSEDTGWGAPEPPYEREPELADAADDYDVYPEDLS